MFQKLQSFVDKLSSYIVVGFLIGMVSFAVFNVLKEDNQYMPVVSDMRPSKSFSYNNGVWSAPIEGIKVKPCIFIAENVYGLVKHNGFWKKTDFFFTNDETPGNSRPTGYQSFDVWNWRGSKDIKEVKVIVQHLCEKSDIVETIVGPFKVKTNLE